MPVSNVGENDGILSTIQKGTVASPGVINNRSTSSSSANATGLPIDTGSQVSNPFEAGADSPPTYGRSDLNAYDATTKDLTGDQLVSGQLDKVLDKGGVLMDVARSTGDELSNSRGALNSSMGAQSSMRAMIDTAMPIAQQDAQSELSQLQTNQTFENRSDEFNATAANQQTMQADNFDATAAVQQHRDTILQSYQLQMENLSTNNKSLLIDLEQKYSAAIQSDQNASNVYVSTMESIAELMREPDLSVEQQESGLSELVGMLDAYLDFNVNLNSVDAINPSGSNASRDARTSRQITRQQSQLDTALEKQKKFNEYTLELNKLGTRPSSNFYGSYDDDGYYGNRNNSYAVSQWDEAKDSLDLKYKQWLR